MSSVWHSLSVPRPLSSRPHVPFIHVGEQQPLLCQKKYNWLPHGMSWGEGPKLHVWMGKRRDIFAFDIALHGTWTLQTWTGDMRP